MSIVINPPIMDDPDISHLKSNDSVTLKNQFSIHPLLHLGSCI